MPETLTDISKNLHFSFFFFSLSINPHLASPDSRTASRYQKLEATLGLGRGNIGTLLLRPFYPGAVDVVFGGELGAEWFVKEMIANRIAHL